MKDPIMKLHKLPLWNFISSATLASLSRKININIYIYISKDLMWESMRSYHVVHSLKRSEILLSHDRDKNKFKNIDSLFPLNLQWFKTTFCFFWFNVSRVKTTISIIWFNVSRLFLSLRHKLFAFSFTLFHFYSLHFQIHSYQKQFHLPSTFQRHLYNSILLYHLILAHMSIGCD